MLSRQDYQTEVAARYLRRFEKDRDRLFTFQFVLELFVEAEGLLPAFKFVAGLLDFFFVRPEIEQHISVRHDGSLRCEALGSQGGGEATQSLSYLRQHIMDGCKARF